MDYCLIARCINNFHITHWLICPELSTRACGKNGLMYFYMHMNINAVASSDTQKMSGENQIQIISMATRGIYILTNCIQKIFAPVLFSPLSPSFWAFWANSIVSYYLSLTSTVFGRIQDETKLFAYVHVEGRKLHGGKINMFTVFKQ